VGTKDLRLLNGGCSTAPMPWHFELTSKDSGATWSIESDLAAKTVREIPLCSKPSQHETRLAPGGHQMNVLGAHHLLALSKETLKQLPVGRYVVKASYRERPLHDPERPCPFWHGTVTTGPVEIEVKAKPGAVFWGEAVNGLQVGLQVIGGREEMRLRRIADLTRVLARLTGPEHRMPLVRALGDATQAPELSYLKTQLEPLQQELAGGHTLSEALQLQRNGLIADQVLWDGVKAGETAGDLPAAMARLAEEFAKKAQSRGLFGEHKEICTIARLRNVSEKEITLYDSCLHFCLGLQFTRRDGGPTIFCYPEDLKKRLIRPLVLPAKGEVGVEFSVQPRWVFETKGAADGGGIRLKGVPPGKYAATAGYGHGEHPQREPCPCWHGGITSGAVQVEIEPLPVGEVRARETGR
jgi:hypothetical protein